MVNDTSYIPENFSLSSNVRDQLSNRSGSQRCILGEPGEMLIIVHEVPEFDNLTRRALLFWKAPSCVWQSANGSDGLKDLSQLLERYSQIINRNEALVDDADTAKEIFHLIRNAAPLARSSRNLYLTLVDASSKFPKERELRNLRDRAQEIERAAELLYADSKAALEFYRAEHAEEQAEASARLAKIGYRLNLIAGLAMPLVAFGGLMGMNVNIPHAFQESFWKIVIAGFLLGLGILYLVGRNLDEKK